MSVLAKIEGEPIPGYRLKKRIGAGGYGEVWKAEAPGELMKALKFVFGYHDEDRASRELKALTRIRAVRHPFLLSLERIEVVEGQLVIVTELADGSLKDRFEECKRLGGTGIPRDELLVYIRDAADALDYMSEHHSLQHLDVKPENLLLVGNRIKVADFGLVKDLHDVSVSMLGGLTPLYAPPELFDGSPCRFSDQYSLAIVFMEMLTGVLPFPGTTAAQLATQHLNSRPRLSALSPGDQAAIGKALSKDPQQRFASCRALVESLCQAGAAASGAARRAAQSDTPTIASGETDQNASGQVETGGKSNAPKPASAGKVLGTESHDGAEESTQQKAPAGRPPDMVSEVREPEMKRLTPLPPSKLDTSRAPYRPTLFVGIGGTGAQVLTRLHRRLVDRFGSDGALAALPLLLLDTDAKTLQEAAFGEESPAKALQTLSLPLRKPQDYRSDSKLFAKSTSRRWLYNIPRSLQTDGMRPLGRLALADHAPRVCEQIRTTIQKMLAPESLAATSKALGSELAVGAPRVVLVASISGGAGSGTVLETAYAVRKVLCELGLPQELCGILLHSTPRSQGGRDLAIVNAVACLGELRQFSAGSQGYPGDAACGLPAFAPGVPTFDDTYLLHLGDHLGAEEFEQAAGQVAEYMYLDAVTPTGWLLNVLRREAAAEKPANQSCHLRSFGLCQIGGADDVFAQAAINVLCQNVVQAWLGPDPGARREPSAIDLERLTEVRCTELGLDFDHLSHQVQELVRSEHKRGQSAALDKLQANKLVAFANERTNPLVDWLLGLVNQPGVRVRGAHAAAAWFVARLRQFDDKARELLERIDAERAEVETLLAAAASPEKSKTRGRAQLSPVELAQKREHEAHLGIQAHSMRGARQVLQAICGKVVLVAERLRDLTRDVQFHATQFQVTAIWDEPDDADTDAPERGLAEEVRASARQLLRGKMVEISRRVDAEFHAGFLSGHGGLAAQFATPEQRATLTAALREAARAAVTRGLQSVDIAKALFPSHKPREWAATQFRERVAATQPKLASLSLASQLLLLVPPGADSLKLREIVQFQEGAEPEVLPVTDGGVSLLVESHGAPLESVARLLADDRQDYVEAASRLHTRSDISWVPLQVG